MMPRAPVEPEGTFAGLRASAIVFGAFIDVAVTIVAWTLLVLVLDPDALSGDEAVRSGAAAQLYATTAYLVGNLVIGSLATVVGAFAGAHRAGQLHVRHGGWVAVTSQAIGVLLLAVQPAPSPDPAAMTPLWVDVAAWLLVLPAGMTGGALARALRRR